MKKCLSSLGIIFTMCFSVPSFAGTLEPIELDTSFQKNLIAIVEPSETSENPISSESDEEILPEHEPTMSQSNIEAFDFEKDEFIDWDPKEIFQKDSLQAPTIKLSVQNKHKIIPQGQTLLGDKLYFRFDEGPIEDLLFFGAYRGDMSFNFLNHDSYHTNFDSFMGEMGIVGKFRELPVDYRLSLNFVPAKGVPYWNSMILDNFINIKVKEHNKIRIGHTRVSNGYEGGMSGYIQPFIAKSQISRTFSNARSLGVKLMGTYDLVDYDIGVFSSDRWLLKFFPGAEVAGNINFKPLGKTDGKYGKMIVGTSFSVGHRDNTYQDIGFNVAYRYKKFKWDFEYMTADGYNGKGIHSSNARADGFYTSIYYRLTDKIELLARYDRFVPDRRISCKPQTEYTAGINYRIKGDALKLMLNYVFYDNYNHRTGSRILVGTQFIL